MCIVKYCLWLILLQVAKNTVRLSLVLQVMRAGEGDKEKGHSGGMSGDTVH